MFSQSVKVGWSALVIQDTPDAEGMRTLNMGDVEVVVVAGGDDSGVVVPAGGEDSGVVDSGYYHIAIRHVTSLNEISITITN